MKKMMICMAVWMAVLMMPDSVMALAPVEKKTSGSDKKVEEQSINTPVQKRQMKSKGNAADAEKEKKENTTEEQK